MELLEHLAKKGATPLRKIASQTSNATDGTRSTHAHGLTDARGRAVTPDIVILQATATDADGVLTDENVRFVKVDATNVTVRGTAASVLFTMYVG